MNAFNPNVYKLDAIIPQASNKYWIPEEYRPINQKKYISLQF